MKKFLVILSLLFAFALVGCATSKPVFHSQVKEDVYLNPYHSWVNHPVQCFQRDNCSSWRSITLCLINKKYRDVNVKVECKFQDGWLFGKKEVTVKKRDDKVFAVIGHARSYVGSETVSCRITYLK